MTERAVDVSVSQQDDPILLALRDATIGDYEVLAELGRGGMAAVYLAHDLALDRKVAIKVLFPALLTGEGAAERFMREARTAASLNHPNIIPIYAVKEHESLLYIVMRFVGGRGLDSVLEERPTLPIPMVKAILNEVGEALGYAHRRGVIHRDIKPGNILLDEEGRAVITDFGIAKVSAADSITRTGGVVGTPSYMSPEQCTAGEVTGASDQYSLGLVGYEMLTGDRPFTGESVMQLMYLRCTQDPPPIAEARPDCPPDLAKALMRMLRREPQNRWDSVESAVEAVGSPPSGERDAIRREMAVLAESGQSRRISMGIRTPTSPVPATKEQAVTAGAKPARGLRTRQLWLRWVVPALAAVAVISWLVLRGWGGGPAIQAGPAFILAPEAVAPSGTTATVAAGLEITPPSLTLDAGTAAPLIARATDESGDLLPGAVIEWETSDPAVAGVSALGIVTGLKAGLAIITASSGGVVITSTVTVRALPAGVPREPAPAANAAAVRSIELSPSLDSFPVGRAQPFAVELRDVAGNVVAGRSVSWTSSSPSVATVSLDGVVTALGEGTTRITASSEGVSRSATLVVVPVPVARIEITPNAPSVAVGEAIQLTAVLRDGSGQRLRSRPVDWSSGAPGIATVSFGGSVTGVAAGQAEIIASSSGREARAAVIVTPGEPAPEAAQPTSESIEAVLTAFARAVESRDMTQLRRAYPGMTPDEEEAYRGMFRLVQEFDLRVDRPIDIRGTSAFATGTARYVDRGSEQSFSYRATLDLTSSIWQLTSISFAQQ
ncbi:MAG: protein kinase [Gemmatimonadales bacterium]|nr:protein kinase [Gemmatimonadales bacterium]